jgi:hypothetical protein
VRGVQGNATYIRSHGVARGQHAEAVDVTDPATAIWLNRRAASGEDPLPALCYSHSNTWAKANRGSMVADCLSVVLDLHDGRLDAVAGGSGWTLGIIARMAVSRNVALWMDASALPADRVCTAVQAWKGRSFPGALAESGSKVRRWILELTPGQGSIPVGCKLLQDSGVTLFVRVPDDLSPAQAIDWGESSAAGGWPARYSVDSGQNLAALRVLLAQPGAQWALNDVPIESLPWHATDQDIMAGLPVPMMLGMNTDWDVNSRTVLMP